jgi:hypothetical protein
MKILKNGKETVKYFAISGSDLNSLITLCWNYLQSYMCQYGTLHRYFCLKMVKKR